MRPVISVYLYQDEERFFGEGPCRLLHGIDKTGSLRSAALEMNLSYSKALRMVKRAQDILGFPLTETNIGGKGGGGSVLTEEAKQFLVKYERYREECYEANRRIYSEIFSK